MHRCSIPRGLPATGLGLVVTVLAVLPGIGAPVLAARSSSRPAIRLMTKSLSSRAARFRARVEIPVLTWPRTLRTILSTIGPWQ